MMQNVYENYQRKIGRFSRVLYLVITYYEAQTWVMKSVICSLNNT